MEEESEKVGLKLNIQKIKITASGPITLWGIDGETVETVAHFIFLGSIITADGDCSHEIKRRLLLGRKLMTNLDNILKKQRHWENGIEIHIISYMKRVTSPGLMHDTGCLGLVHWDDPEGWYGEGGGFRMGNTCIPVADSFRYLAKPIQYCKV